MADKFVICAYRPWNVEKFALIRNKLSSFGEVIFISNKKDLSYDRLKGIGPKIVFFLDWSWIIPQNITDEFFCVGFHCAPLPEFRGGSPIQNQIIRGVKNTKLSAFKMDGGIDTGDILVQRNVSLEGHIVDIFNNISNLSFHIIYDIVIGKFVSHKQIGPGSYFKRRTPSQSELTDEYMNHSTIGHLNDFIRMLEDPYPNAYLCVGNKKIVFKNAELVGDTILCNVEIKDNK